MVNDLMTPPVHSTYVLLFPGEIIHQCWKANHTLTFNSHFRVVASGGFRALEA
jgi:hypothetical protein